MPDQTELKFLALLVHRGHLDRREAETILPRLQEGAALDELLITLLGKEPEWVNRMRRTGAGETPEIPGYQILGRAGTGGTADVFRAREKKTGRVLALKVLNRQSTRSTPTRKAFIAEARLLERLDHASLVGGHGVARSGETYFSRMEYVEGATLLEILDRGQALDENAALRIVVEVAEVLSYLHDEGVIHRDVKPGNIMLTGGGNVKLIDLGFAAGEDSAPSPTDSTVGTVAYLSPEQARGGAAADLRSDIYSLGVTLFHLVIGRLPFESSDDREVLRMQIMASLSSPELKGRDLSPHLHYFVEKMMAKDKDVRYQSWGELVGDVSAQLKGRDSLDYSRRPKSRGARRRGPSRGR
jgi:eukaryotic-like serine/threonine-protein kinase